MNQGIRNAWGVLACACGALTTLVHAQPFAPGQPLDAQSEATALPPLRVNPDAQARWVLGMAVTSSPTRAGASDRSVGLRPVVAGQVGRWMLATSSARSLSGGSISGGASTQWAATDRWKLGVGFRLTHGRDSADDPWLSGMPDVRRSLAMRLSAGYALSERWSANVGWQQDLLHQQGGRATLGLGWQYPVGDRWVLDASLGTTWANARAMQTFYGVTAAQSTASRPAWSPGSGWEQWHWGLGASKALDRHWRVSAQVGQGRLLGAAGASPLTLSRLSTTGQLMVAYVGW